MTTSNKNKTKSLKIATVFSGIGAFEQAVKKLGIEHSIVFACDNGEREIKESYDEIINHAHENDLSYDDLQEYVLSLYSATKKPNMMKKSYLENYKVEEKSFYEDIRFIDGKRYENKIDILVGGSPCQSFSMMGKRAGLEDARGTLFYEYARLINETQPKVFIYENVPGMLNHDKGNTWKVIKEIFDSLGYSISFRILNSKDYGIPQNRQRLFVVGFKNKCIDFCFPDETKLVTSMFDYLESKVDSKYYLGEKGFNFVTSNTGRAKINQSIIRTQKANQQFNWNGDFVFEDYEDIKERDDVLDRAYIGEWEGRKGVIRQLTPRECLNLMGFDSSFRIVVPTIWAYRQSGNSIVVNVLQAILSSIIKTGVFNEKN